MSGLDERAAIVAGKAFREVVAVLIDRLPPFSAVTHEGAEMVEHWFGWFFVLLGLAQGIEATDAIEDEVRDHLANPTACVTKE